MSSTFVSGEAGDYDSEEEFPPLFDFSAPPTGFGLDFGEEEEGEGQQRKGEPPSLKKLKF